MGLLDGEIGHPVAEVVDPLLEHRRPRLDAQAVVQAGLARRVARNQMDLVVADRHRVAVGVRRGVGNLVAHRYARSDFRRCQFRHLPRRAGMNQIRVRDRLRQIAHVRHQPGQQPVELFAHAPFDFGQVLHVGQPDAGQGRNASAAARWCGRDCV